MPTNRPSLDLQAAESIAAEAFAPATEQRWGIEVEQLVTSADSELRRPSESLMNALQSRRLPHGSRFTSEPGGQAELSTLPTDDVDSMLDALNIDLAEMQRRIACAGFVTEDRALDGSRPPDRILHRPRYAAMESYFAHGGTAGTWMMCNSASVQINVSHDGQDPGRRWQLLHRLAPALIATFANSPGLDTRGQAWKSVRQANWWAIDPTRTGVPAWQDLPPAQAWAEYALSADVMLIQVPGQVVPMTPGTSFAEWIQFGHPLGWPTPEDFRYHLTTLFPPIRPRGWLEIRFLDALEPDHRVAACLLLAACLTDPAIRELEVSLPDVSHLWTEAARVGLENAELARAVDVMFDIAERYVTSVSRSFPRISAFQAFRSRYVDGRRCPADGFDPARQTNLALEASKSSPELLTA